MARARECHQSGACRQNCPSSSTNCLISPSLIAPSLSLSPSFPLALSFVRLSFYGSCLAWEVVDLDGVGRQASRTDHSRQFIIRAAAAVGGGRKSSLWSLLLLLRPIPHLYLNIASVRFEPVCNTCPAQFWNCICNEDCRIWFWQSTRTMRNFNFPNWTSKEGYSRSIIRCHSNRLFILNLVSLALIVAEIRARQNNGNGVIDTDIDADGPFISVLSVFPVSLLKVELVLINRILQHRLIR